MQQQQLQQLEQAAQASQAAAAAAQVAAQAAQAAAQAAQAAVQGLPAQLQQIFEQLDTLLNRTSLAHRLALQHNGHNLAGQHSLMPVRHPDTGAMPLNFPATNDGQLWAAGVSCRLSLPAVVRCATQQQDAASQQRLTAARHTC